MGRITAMQTPLRAPLGKVQLPGGGIHTVYSHPRSLATVGVQHKWVVGVPPPCLSTACAAKVHVCMLLPSCE